MHVVPEVKQPEAGQAEVPYREAICAQVYP
jgi:hypothetical protein